MRNKKLQETAYDKRCQRRIYKRSDELQEGRNSCPLLRSYCIGSCHVGISKRFSRSISLAVYCLFSYIFWLIRSLVDPALAAFIVCGPLQFLVSHLCIFGP